MGSAGSNESALSFYLREQPTQLATTFPHSGPSFFPLSFISWKNNGKLYIAKDL